MISFFSAVAVVVMIKSMPRLHKFIYRFVLYLAVSQAFNSVAEFFGSPSDPSFLCSAQALMLSFFGMASVLWTVVLAYLLQLSVRRPRAMLGVKKREWRMHAFVWGVSFFLCLLPQTTGDYGQAGGWCWIRKDVKKTSDDAWRMLTFYIPLWSCMAYNLVVLVRTRKALGGLVPDFRHLFSFPLCLSSYTFQGL